MRAWGLTLGLGLGALGLGVRSQAPDPRPEAPYEILAVRYATIAQYRAANLIAGVDTSRRIDLAMMVWLVRSADRTVLMDAGFYRDKFISRWKPVDFVKPSVAVERAGVRADQVTDIIVSHVHWDHLDGADLFPNARIWIQRAEYDYYVDSLGRPRRSTIDTLDAAMLADMQRAGRVRLVDGDSTEIMPGIRVFTGGKHTFASQFATVATASGTIVLASDNAYLYENFERQRPIAQTLDSVSNIAAQKRMLQLAGSLERIIPGHDPGVFARFPASGEGIARITPRSH